MHTVRIQICPHNCADRSGFSLCTAKDASARLGKPRSGHAHALANPSLCRTRLFPVGYNVLWLNYNRLHLVHVLVFFFFFFFLSVQARHISVSVSTFEVTLEYIYLSRDIYVFLNHSKYLFDIPSPKRKCCPVSASESYQ